MSNHAWSGAVSVAVVMGVGWFLLGNEIGLIILGLGVVLLYVIAHTLRYDLPNKLSLEEINSRLDDIDATLKNTLLVLEKQIPEENPYPYGPPPPPD